MKKPRAKALGCYESRNRSLLVIFESDVQYTWAEEEPKERDGENYTFVLYSKPFYVTPCISIRINISPFSLSNFFPVRYKLYDILENVWNSELVIPKIKLSGAINANYTSILRDVRQSFWAFVNFVNGLSLDLGLFLLMLRGLRVL